MATFDVNKAIKSSKQSAPLMDVQSKYEDALAKATGKAVGGSDTRFSGGILSDVFDWLQLPQSVVTAAFSKKYTVSDALTKRITPSEVLGLKGGKGFLADLVLDPLWFVGVGATTSGVKALKAGTQLKTLGAAVKAGEKSLLKISAPFSDKGFSLAKALGLGKLEEKAAEGLTRLSGVIKRVPLGGDKTIGRALNGMFGNTEGFKKGLSLDDIEREIAGQKYLRGQAKAPVIAARVSSSGAMQDIEPVIRLADKLDATELAKFYDGVFRYKQIGKAPLGLSKIGQEMFARVQPMLDTLIKDADVAKLNVLKNKMLSNLPVKELEKKLKLGVGSKPLQTEQRLEKFANTFKVNGKLYQGTKTKAVNIINPKDVLIKHKENWVPASTVNKLKSLENEKRVVLEGIDRLKSKVDSVEPGAKRVLKRQINEAGERLGDIGQELNFLTKMGGKGVREAAMPFEVNAARASVGLKPIYKEDALEALHATISEVGSYKARVTAIDNIKKSGFIEDVGKMSDADLAASGLERIKIKGLEDFAASPPMKRALEHTIHGYSSLGPLEDTVRTWHEATNFFKKASTYWWPAFHARNAISNLWQISLAGVRNPVDAVRGYKSLWTIGKLQKQGLRGEKLITAIESKLGKDTAQYYQEFVKEGLGGTGRYFGDIDQALAKRNVLDRAGGAVGNYLEDSSKFSLYMQRRKANYVADAAAHEVRKYLFDYSDLTDFEKIVMKGVMPFYTWSRNNIPLQLAMLIQKPSKIAILPKVKKAIESMQDGEPMDETLLPEWMREGYNIYLGQNPEGIQKFLRLEGFLPTIDLNAFADPGREVVGQLSPFIKTPLELFTNQDFYFNRPIKEYEGQTTNVLGAEVSPWVGKLARTFRPVNEIARATGLDDAELSVTDKMLRGLLGINIKGFDPKKQEDVFDMLVGKNKSKLKSEIKKAQEKGDDEKVSDLQELLRMVEQNTTL